MARRILPHAVAAALAAICWVTTGHGAEARRVALVIGNSTYSVKPLANPANDATAVAKALTETLGFEHVELKHNATRQQMVEALKGFEDLAKGAEIAVVYFAGHGTALEQIDTYLVPIDAHLAREADLEDEAVSLKSVLRRLEGVHGLRLVILDACRNPPFALSGRKRDTSRGLGRVEPEDNTLIAYATKDGTTADDGTGPHSPFTAALLKHIATPGIDVTFVFRAVRDDVMSATSRLQQPHLYGTLGGKPIYLKAGDAGQQTAMLQPPATQGGATMQPPAENLQPRKMTLRIRIERDGADKKGKIGSQVIDVPTHVLEAVGHGQRSGVWVVRPLPNSPAEAAGVKAGDLIVAIDGRPTANAAALTTAVDLVPTGTEVAVELWRAGTSLDEVVAQLRERAGKDDVAAMMLLREFAAWSVGVPFAERTMWNRRAAEAGNGKAMVFMGADTEFGNGLPKDEAEAMRWYRKAVESGEAGAMTNLGFMYANGRGVPKDEAEAVRWYRKGAEAGVAGAMYNLAIKYKDGIGIAKDAAEAVRWFRKAAEAGNAGSMTFLAFMYANGIGIAKDDGEAMRWYRKAAEAGEAGAMTNLGFMYDNGSGVPKDAAEAVRWYRKGADAGDAYAMTNLGIMYDNGSSVPKDAAEAVRWFRKGAEAGRADAMYNLGRQQDRGEGIARDPAAAAAWVFKAIEKGSEFSVKEMSSNSAGWTQQFRRAFQEKLKVAGLYSGPIDGEFGSGVKAAIEQLAARSRT